MGRSGTATLFLLGKDYHLGDLLWLSAVIVEYRRQRSPGRVVVGCPDVLVNRILERCPVIDEVLYGPPERILSEIRRRDEEFELQDLRPWPLACRMLKGFRHRLPWLYYRDLWMQPRGQWLATLLRMGTMTTYRPVLELRSEDREIVRSVRRPYVLLAPHIGRYKLPLAASVWRRIKGWQWSGWIQLASRLRELGYEVVTLSAVGQDAVPGTLLLAGLPIPQVAGVIEGAAALVSCESGLWFIAAALQTPFVIVPWWLPESVNWPASMNVPHRLIRRNEASVERVLETLGELGVENISYSPAEEVEESSLRGSSVAPHVR